MQKKINELVKLKSMGQKISMLTGYDYPMARLIDSCGIDVILVGDSLGTNILGYDSVEDVSVADMKHHLKAVKKGTNHAIILCDMPFGSFNTAKEAVANAKLLIESGADAVKIESEIVAIEKMRSVIDYGIPVCAHIGYTPQTPGLKASVQGKDLTRAKELVSLAKKCEAVGAFMIVLELMPERLSKLITENLSIPTIGIGAGRFCDGQVQVNLDILGISKQVFRHTKQYADISNSIKDAICAFKEEILCGYFPTDQNSSCVDSAIIEKVELFIKENY